jgi:hypothetical protein
MMPTMNLENVRISAKRPPTRLVAPAPYPVVPLLNLIVLESYKFIPEADDDLS